MTTETKPLPEHGTNARAKGRPATGVPRCPCLPCRAAARAYEKRRRVLNATGRTLRVPVEPVAAHLDTLFAADAGWMQLAEFDYHLPEELIAQEALADRAASRMLVVHRDAERWEDRCFRELPEFLRAGDCLVLNDSKVFPARLFGTAPRGVNSSQREMG